MRTNRKPALHVSSRVAVWTALAAVICAAAASSAGAAAGPYRVLIIAGINTTLNNQPTAVQGAIVAAKNINKSGGLRGRGLSITFCNHLGTGDGAAACARQAVSGNFDDVISTNNTFSQISTPILSAAGIPQIASQATSDADFADKLSFPLYGGSQPSWAADAFYMVKTLKKTKVAGIGFNLSTSILLENLTKQAIARAGGQLTTWEEVSPTTTDYTPVVQKVKDSGAQGVITILNGAGELSWARASAQLGLNVPFAHWTLTVAEPDFVNYPNLGDGMVVASPFPIYSTPTKGARTFVTQMKKARYGPTIYTSAPAIASWLQLYAIQALAQRVPKGTAITSASLMAAANAAKAKNPISVQGVISWSPGLPGPADYQNVANDTVWIYVVDHGTLNFKTTLHPWKLLGLTR